MINIMDKIPELKGHVKIFTREAGTKDWELRQEFNNIITTYGKQFILDASIVGSPAGSVTFFEVGAGGRETADVTNTSGATAGSIPFGLTGSERASQTFYTATGAVSRIVLVPATNTGTPTDDLIVSLYHTSGAGAPANPGSPAIPTGTALTNEYVRNRDWMIGSSIAFNIRDVVDIVIGSKYAVVVGRSGTTLSTSNYYWLNSYATTDTYASGHSFRLSGTAWNINTAGSIDLQFTTYYPTFDGAPIPKTVSSNTLVIPVTKKAITATTRTNQAASVQCDLASTDANTPGKINEIRLLPNSTGSAIAIVAFRDEDKIETNEMQIVYQVQF